MRSRLDGMLKIPYHLPHHQLLLKIMLKPILVTSLLFLTACTSLSPVMQSQKLETAEPDPEPKFEPLPSGHQGSIDHDERVINLPAGKSYYAAYALGKGHGPIYLQLRTYLQSHNGVEGFFYPVIELLDHAKRPLETIKPQLRFTQQSSDGRYAAVPLQLSPEIGFIIIRTSPKLYGQEASYTTKHEGASWTYSSSPFNKRYPAIYLPVGKVELLTPDEGYAVPFEKLRGMYWQFAIAQGGTKLASTDDFIPDLTVAGGPSLGLGYAWPVYGRPYTTIRTQAQVGYYTAEDEDGVNNSLHYLTTDALWVESNQVSSLGFGLTYTTNHTWKYGKEEITYDPAIGPKLILEIRGAYGVTLGASLAWQDFKDSSGKSKRNNQWGIYFNSFF